MLALMRIDWANRLFTSVIKTQEETVTAGKSGTRRSTISWRSTATPNWKRAEIILSRNVSMDFGRPPGESKYVIALNTKIIPPNATRRAKTSPIGSQLVELLCVVCVIRTYRTISQPGRATEMPNRPPWKILVRRIAQTIPDTVAMVVERGPWLKPTSKTGRSEK